jgi:hypothetical protein
MMGAKYRVVLAALAIFVAIFGIAAAIRGLLFDQGSALRYGVAAVVGGVTAFVLLLNPTAGIDDDARHYGGK